MNTGYPNRAQTMFEQLFANRISPTHTPVVRQTHESKACTVPISDGWVLVDMCEYSKCSGKPCYHACCNAYGSSWCLESVHGQELSEHTWSVSWLILSNAAFKRCRWMSVSSCRMPRPNKNVNDAGTCAYVHHRYEHATNQTFYAYLLHFPLCGLALFYANIRCFSSFHGSSISIHLLFLCFPLFDIRFSFRN